MKYIRTKNGIWLNGGKFGCHLVGIVGKKHEYDFGFCFDKTDIIKQANTIEELCDEKVGTFEDKSKPYIYKKTSWADLKKDWTQYHDNVFGAIWTDKGLIYVAKMNEEGELELL